MYKVEDDIRKQGLEGDKKPDYRQLKARHLERTLRCIPMGRKNWMFCWTLEGADNVAVFHTLIVSCRLAGIDPYKYMVDVLQRISLHPARNIRDLIPRIWQEKFGANPLKSDLD